MKVNLYDVRPGQYVDRPWLPAQNGTAVQVEQVTLLADNEATLRLAGGEYIGSEDDDQVEVTSTPPRVLMSWDVDSQTWAILIDTTDGAGQSRLNVHLNDAELFDGATDADA